MVDFEKLMEDEEAALEDVRRQLPHMNLYELKHIYWFMRWLKSLHTMRKANNIELLKKFAEQLE